MAAQFPVKNSRPTVARAIGLLIVDDDTVLRETLAASMRRRGYVVWTAADGNEAIQLFRSHQDAIDLVLADLNMPKFDGAMLIRHLRSEDPTVHCRLMTGEHRARWLDQLADDDAAGLIIKPFSACDLIDSLAQDLGHPVVSD